MISMKKWQGFRKFVFVLFLVLIIASVFIFQIAGENFGLEQMRQYLKDFGIWAPIIFIVLYTIGTIFIPSTPFMAVAGILFGFKYGLFYTIIGGLLSSIIVFTISRHLGRDWVESILKNEYLKNIDKYNRRLENGAIWDLILLRAAPVMPFNVLNILMGVSRINLGDYLFGTVIGLIPSNVVAVYFGTFITKLF